MPNTFQLKYDEMEAIAKKFRQQGEDIGRLHDVTRQRVRDIQKEWIGDAAVKFTKEMEEVLLPALKRLSQALLYTQDVSLDISKIIRTADEETAAYFKDRLSGDDFGAGKFGDALQGLQGMRAGADDFGAGQFGAALGGLSGGGGGSTPDDFGAGKFGEALGGAPGGGGGSVADDFGAGKFQEAGAPGSSEGFQGGDKGSPDQGGGPDKPDKPDKPETEPAMSGGGGGGGGGGESQGLKGDLKGMGAGLSDQASQSGVMGAAGGSGAMADSIYSSGGGAGGGGGQPQPAGTGSGGGGGEAGPDAGSAAAAGAAGVVGTAAAGGAAKVIKEQKSNDSK